MRNKQVSTHAKIVFNRSGLGSLCVRGGAIDPILNVNAPVDDLRIRNLSFEVLAGESSIGSVWGTEVSAMSC